jgi:hypothetical protein
MTSTRHRPAMHTSLHFERRVHWLGYLGLAPLALGSSWVLIEPASATAIDFVKNYAAIILTFVGAIHWGRAMHMQHSRLLTWSVLPSLLAFSCLMIPSSIALPFLALGFILQLMLDSHQYRPLPWFLRIRFHLTAAVVLLLLVAWLFSL